MRAASAADMQAEFAGERIEPALQGPDDGGRDARRMPVHAHDGAERLEPERMGEPAQELVAAVFDARSPGDDRAEPRHPLAEPARHAPAVQRQVGAAGAARGHGAPPGGIRAKADTSDSLACRRRRCKSSNSKANADCATGPLRFSELVRLRKGLRARPTTRLVQASVSTATGSAPSHSRKGERAWISRPRKASTQRLLRQVRDRLPIGLGMPWRQGVRLFADGPTDPVARFRCWISAAGGSR